MIHRVIEIYLFIYCHLYSQLSIVQCSNALYRLWHGEIQGHTGQPSVWEIDAQTMYNQWATAPGRSLNYPRPKSITHLRTFSDDGVYVALQLFFVHCATFVNTVGRRRGPKSRQLWFSFLALETLSLIPTVFLFCSPVCERLRAGYRSGVEKY